MLKEQNQAQAETIASLKKEIREMELNKARHESQKAEIEYNLRAKDYNVEIIKNQLENVNTEIEIERAQHEKVKKSFNYLKMAYARMKGEKEHKKGRKISKSRIGKSSQLTTPNELGASELNKSANMRNLESSAILDISGLSAFNPEENRMSIGAPSDLGQSLMPYLTAQLSASESQCDIWSVAEMASKDAKIKLLSDQLEERQKLIDDLEKKFESANKHTKDSDKVRNLKYDNQILIG